MVSARYSLLNQLDPLGTQHPKLAAPSPNRHEGSYLELQKAQSRSCLNAFGTNVGGIYINSACRGPFAQNNGLTCRPVCHIALDP